MEIPKRGESAGGVPIYDTPANVVEVRGWFLGATDLVFEDRRTGVLRDFDGEKLHVVFLDSVRRRFAPPGAPVTAEQAYANRSAAAAVGEVNGWVVAVEQHDGPDKYFGPFTMIGAAESYAKRNAGTVEKLLTPPTRDQLLADLVESMTYMTPRVANASVGTLKSLIDRIQGVIDAQ